MTKDEALKQALEALKRMKGYGDTFLYRRHEQKPYDQVCEAINAIEALAEQPSQQQAPVAYDKTEINCFAQDLYDQKMREGEHGHYESMFHVIHQCIKKTSPPASKPWVGLTDEERNAIGRHHAYVDNIIRATEAKLREKNAQPSKPLSSVELVKIELSLRKYHDYDRYDLSLHEFARAIEAAHGIKGDA